MADIASQSVAFDIDLAQFAVDEQPQASRPPTAVVRDGKVVKGVRFRSHRTVGDIVELATRYCAETADELVFYDITASPEGRSVDVDWVRRVSETIDIPFCVAGGIRSVESAARILSQGADKISINTPALENPGLIDQMVKDAEANAAEDSKRRELSEKRNLLDTTIYQAEKLVAEGIVADAGRVSAGAEFLSIQPDSLIE